MNIKELVLNSQEPVPNVQGDVIDVDIEQVRLAKAGDVEEIGKLIVAHTQNMYRVAFSILKNEDEIYDAISNTTVIVFEKISTLKKEEFFKTWLTRILINECYKIYNRNKKIIYLENCNQEALEKSQYNGNNDVDELEVRELIKGLSQDLREIVVLYYIEDYSVKEIAKCVGIPEGTVKSRLSRARKDLEKILIKNKEAERRDSNG